MATEATNDSASEIEKDNDIFREARDSEENDNIEAVGTTEGSAPNRQSNHNNNLEGGLQSLIRSVSDLEMNDPVDSSSSSSESSSFDSDAVKDKINKGIFRPSESVNGSTTGGEVDSASARGQQRGERSYEDSMQPTNSKTKNPIPLKSNDFDGKISSDNINSSTPSKKPQCASDQSRTTTPASKFSIHQLQHLLREQKKHYEAQLFAREQSHQSEIDEVLTQLDTIEKSYMTEVQDLSNQVEKKQLMIEALTNSLSETRATNSALTRDIQSNSKIQAKLREDIMEHSQMMESLRTKLEQTELKVAEERNSKRKAVKDAESAVRTAAESQFALANKTYQKLKADHKDLTKLKSKADKEVETLEARIERVSKDAKLKEDSLYLEIEKLESQLQSSQQELINFQEEFKKQNTMWEDTQKKFVEKYDMAKKESAEAHQLVGSVVREKETLKKENVELSALCEELMGIVEGK